MAIIKIPDGHHVTRVCPRNRLIRSDGNVVGVHPDLYKLRVARNEEYLSAQYLEFYDGDEKSRLRCCVSACMFPVRDEDYMVVLNAGQVRAIGKTHKLDVRVVHAASRTNPSYAHIKNTPSDPSHAMLAELARVSASKLFSVNSIQLD